MYFILIFNYYFSHSQVKWNVDVRDVTEGGVALKQYFLEATYYRKCPSGLLLVAILLPILLVVVALLVVGLLVFYWFWLRPEYAAEAQREMQLMGEGSGGSGGGVNKR